jgi:hypothetical protein
MMSGKVRSAVSFLFSFFQGIWRKETADEFTNETGRRHPQEELSA